MGLEFTLCINKHHVLQFAVGLGLPITEENLAVGFSELVLLQSKRG